MPKNAKPVELEINLDEMIKRGATKLEIDIDGKVFTVDLTKHLQGQHDQSEHGRGGGVHVDEQIDDGGNRISGGTGRSGRRPKPDEGKKPFDKAEWEAMDMNARRATFDALPKRERMRLGDAAKSVPERQKQLMEGMPPRPNTGNLSKDIKARLEHFKDRVHPDAIKKIGDVARAYDKDLKDAGSEEGPRRKLAMEALDALGCQEMEASTRTLGDHGISHIEGNIRFGKEMLRQLPEGDDPVERATLMTAMIFHDTGYMTPASQIFMDHDHPAWSADHYDANIRPTVEKALGRGAARHVTSIIETHDAKTIDWKDDPVGTSARVADNIALFHKEKLPPMLRYVPDNLQLMKDLAGKKISLEDCRKQMLENIKGSKDVPDKMKALLSKSIPEISEYSPKPTLGMLGGEIGKLKWNGNNMEINLRENKDNTELNRLGDFGQRQFLKFCETYGIDPAVFKKQLGFELKDDDGKVLLKAIYSKKRKAFILEFVKDE